MGTKYASSFAHPPDGDSGFAGTLKNIQLNDLIQMCCLSASSICMRVAKDCRVGTIFIVDGEIIHAACEDIVGEEAFYRILGWQTGSFESLEVGTIPQRTIQKNYHFLVMEAARRVDEKAHVGLDHSEAGSGLSAETAENWIRVLIVDDSPVMRKILSSMLTASNRVKVVGMAGNGKEAIAMIDDLRPDLVTLDVNMPVMDGISTIKHIMIKKPCPVVIMSNPGHGSSKTIFNFLELGAVDFINKPTKDQDIFFQQQKIFERIRVAATAVVGNFRIARIPRAKTGSPERKPIERACRCLVIVISGPGGHPEQMSLLSRLVPALAEKDGAVVAIQSLPSSFSEPFASYLFERCGCQASPIDHERSLSAGHCYVGNHGWPLTVNWNGHQPVIVPGAPEKGLVQVDRLLITAATVFKHRLAVVLLSGANTGKQSGLRVVHENGGRVILRKRASGMVAEPLDPVVEAGLADEEVNPADLKLTVLNGLDLKH
ncbi:MAG: response regulator [Desulfosarcina sp.]|nr:response regulator [Desulfosarcina sp.]